LKDADIVYRIELKRISDRKKEAIESAGDLKQFTKDLVTTLKRLYPPDKTKHVLYDQVLPIIEEEAGFNDVGSRFPKLVVDATNEEAEKEKQEN